MNSLSLAGFAILGFLVGAPVGCYACVQEVLPAKPADFADFVDAVANIIVVGPFVGMAGIAGTFLGGLFGVIGGCFLSVALQKAGPKGRQTTESLRAELLAHGLRGDELESMLRRLGRQPEERL